MMKLKVIKFNSVNSTNDIAIKLIKKNKISPSIIITKNQKKGKGTRGKKWISKKNNLFISIFFDISSSSIKFRQFSILNPYIIRSILKKYTKSKIDIKWPNDLLINKQKVSGILQETVFIDEKQYLIIGIGINTLVHPKNKDFKSTSLVKWSNKSINNSKIFNNIKVSYEKFISDINKYKITYLKKKFCKE